MAPRESPALTPLDASLLAALEEEPNLVRACRRLGISRDRGVYRLARMRRALGTPVGPEPPRASRGGAHATQRGRSAAPLPRAAGDAPLARPAEGTRALGAVDRPVPRGSGSRVVLASGLALAVGFSAPEGARVRVQIDPESVLLARGRFATSARNVLAGRVSGLRRLDSRRWLVLVRVGAVGIPSVVTPSALEELGLRRGAPVWLYVKALAVRLAGGP